MLISAINFTAVSQNVSIIGKAVDTSGSPLGSATIYLEKMVDSTLIGYTISNNDGTFKLTEQTTEKNANLFISFTGLQTYHRVVELEEEVNLGTIAMETQENNLNEVTVMGNAPPLRISKDTIEFNADSFETRPDATLEDLIKKLPGFEITREGIITINGTLVSRIIVNGEKFFGDDPQIALQNSPKMALDKIQVTDTKTEEQAFTGEEGDSNTKMVNVTLKKDKNSGYFARATAGYGTNDRYEVNGICNYMNDNFRASALLGSNNINNPGFSYDRTFGMMKQGPSGFGEAQGIIQSTSTGLDFANKIRNEWGFKEVETNGSYFFGRTDDEQRGESQTEYLLPDSRYFSNLEYSRNSLNNNHRGNAEFEIEFDILTRIVVKPRLNATFSNSNRQSFSESLDEEGNLVNNAVTTNRSVSEARDFQNGINYIKKYGRKGAFVRLQFTNRHQNQNSENLLFSEANFVEEDDVRTQIQDQLIDADNKEDSYSFEARHRIPASEPLSFDSSYDLDYSIANNKRLVYDSNGDNAYNNLIDTLSTNFNVRNRIHSPRFGLNCAIKSWEIEADLGLLLTHLENEDLFRQTSFENDYTNLNVSTEIKYEPPGEPFYSIEYETSTRIPYIFQLQPVIDRTDPLNIQIGNPELRPTYRHDILLEYRNYNLENARGINANVSLNIIENDVVSVRTINEDLVRVTRYTNVEGSIRAAGNLSYFKNYRAEKANYNFSLSLSGGYFRNIGFTNGTKFKSDQLSFWPYLSFRYSLDQILEINSSYRPVYNITNYNIEALQNRDFFNHNSNLEITAYWPKDFILGNDFSFQLLENVAPGLRNAFLLGNLSLGYQFWDDNAILPFKVYDLLDQNIDTRRTINDDYIRDSNNLILTRYAMLTFSYNINTIGNKVR